MVGWKEKPKGIIDAIYTAIGIAEGVAEEFPGGTMRCEYTDDIVTLWYEKGWKIENTKIDMQVVVRVRE